MPEQTPSEPSARFPGLDAAATPIIGVGLGLTGLILGLRPRMAAWPLALTAAAALLYRDPARTTPATADALFAPADGTITDMRELYEHRFLHTDAVRLSITSAPFDVPVQRSPTAGVVAYVEHVAGERRALSASDASDANERLYIGLKTSWGPVLLALVAGPLVRRIACPARVGDRLRAGQRLCTMRLGARVDLFLPYQEVDALPAIGERLRAGVTQIGSVPAH